MCVAQFREYCKASQFKKNYSNEYQNDLKDTTKEVGVYIEYKNMPDVHYVTDLKKMKQLAKSGNQYAINHLKKSKS